MKKENFLKKIGFLFSGRKKFLMLLKVTYFQ